MLEVSQVVIRALLLWCAIIPFAILNGALRDLVFAKMLGPRVARAASGIVLSLVILAWAALTVPWLPISRATAYLGVGVLWLLLTVAFEFLFGVFVAKRSWSGLLRSYQFRDGDMWPFVLVVVAVSPLLAAMLHRKF